MNVHDTEKVANLLLHHGAMGPPRKSSTRRSPDHQHVFDPGEGRAPALQRPRPRCASGRRLHPAGCSRWQAASRSRKATRCCAASTTSTSCSARTTCAGCPAMAERRSRGRARAGPGRGDSLARALRPARASSGLRRRHPRARLRHGDGRLRHVLQLLHRTGARGVGRSADPPTRSWRRRATSRARGVVRRSRCSDRR